MIKGVSVCPECGTEVASKKKAGIGRIIAILLAFLIIGGGTGFLIYMQQSKLANYQERVADSSHKSSEFKVEYLVDDDVDVEVDGSAGRTVMVYIIGSNLETYGSFASADIEEMLAAEISDNVNVIIQTGGADTWHTDGIEDGKVQRFKISDGKLVELENLGKVSMVEQDTLTDFIKYSAENYPAGAYTLVMWDHGGAIPLSFGQDELFSGDLDCVEIGNALRDSGVHFEAVVFDACLMCSLELMLSIQDSAEYIVAAETSEPGMGQQYTGWLTAISQDESILTMDFCEIIASDFMDDIHAHNQVGSISVIRLSKVDEVYDAYIDYMEMVYENVVEKDGYAEYYIARGECGSLENVDKNQQDNTDAVDLSTLAIHYQPDADIATALINAVSNAVVYTESDLSYGHGITTYSPYGYILYEYYGTSYDLYKYGRETWELLGYDEVVEAFYDYFASRIYDNAGLSSTPSWYVPDGDYNNNDADVEGNVLAIENLGDYYVCKLTEDDWSIVSTVYVNLDIQSTLSSGETFSFHVGQYSYYTTDENGYLIITSPAKLFSMNDQIAMYDVIDYYEDSSTGEWEELGMVYATVNGNDSVILIYWSSDNPEGQIIGYRDYDFDTETIGDVTYSFEAKDSIETLYYVYLSDGDYILPLYDAFTYEDCFFEYLYVEEDQKQYAWEGFSTIISYTVTTVYGGKYETPEITIDY